MPHRRDLRLGGSPGNASEVAWLATRLESWDAVMARRASSRFILPELLGVTGLLFGVGPSGEQWLARLAASDWFSGYVPRPEDLAPGEEVRGRWRWRPGVLTDEAATALETPTLPTAYWAAVAVSGGADSSERSAALDLVDALRRRRDPGEGRLPVVVTLDSSSPQDEAFVSGLRRRGAFVVRPAEGVSGDHLHHLPLRALVDQRRLVCVDVVDTLLLWRAGGIGILHTIPAAAVEAVQALGRSPLLRHGARAVDLRFHHDLDHLPDGVFHSMERLCDQCREHLLTLDGDCLFTTSSRLDGRTGTADLLVIC